MEGYALRSRGDPSPQVTEDQTDTSITHQSESQLTTTSADQVVFPTPDKT